MHASAVIISGLPGPKLLLLRLPPLELGAGVARLHDHRRGWGDVAPASVRSFVMPEMRESTTINCPRRHKYSPLPARAAAEPAFRVGARLDAVLLGEGVLRRLQVGGGVVQRHGLC